MGRKPLLYSDRVISVGALAALAVSAGLFFASSVIRDADELRIFGAFALLVAASEMFEVTLPNDRQFSLGIAPALGFALLGSIVPASVHRPLHEVLMMFAVGVGIATLMRMSMKKPLQLVDAAIHFLALAGGTAIYQAFAGLADKMAGSHHMANQAFIFNTCANKNLNGMHGCAGAPADKFTDLSIFGLIAMLLVVVLIETTLNAYRQVERNPVPVLPIFKDQIRSTGALHLSILSVGSL